MPVLLSTPDPVCLLPVPGDSGDYDWNGFLTIDQHPQEYNPSRHYIATANHNILPEGYKQQLSHEWAAPFRYKRIVEMLAGTIDVASQPGQGTTFTIIIPIVTPTAAEVERNL